MNSVEIGVDLVGRQLQRTGRALFAAPVSTRFALGVFNTLTGPHGSQKKTLPHTIGLRSTKLFADPVVRRPGHVHAPDMAYSQHQAAPIITTGTIPYPQCDDSDRFAYLRPSDGPDATDKQLSSTPFWYRHNTRIRYLYARCQL